jgi:hypothetical protein
MAPSRTGRIQNRTMPQPEKEYFVAAKDILDIQKHVAIPHRCPAVWK